MYINYEYTQTDEIDAVETFHETSLQFQRKDTKKRGCVISHFYKKSLFDYQIVMSQK